MINNLTEDEQKIILKVFMSKFVILSIGSSDSPLTDDEEEMYWKIFHKLESRK